MNIGGPHVITAALFGIVCAWTIAFAAGSGEARVSNRWNVTAVGAVFLAFVVAHVANLTGASDRANYAAHFDRLAAADTPWTIGAFDPLFNALLWVIARFTDSDRILYGLIAAIAAVSYYIAGRILMPAWASYLALFTVVASGLFVAYTSVVVRQGIAIPLLLIAGAMYATGRGRWPVYAGLLVAASLLHWSAAPLAAVLAALRVRPVSIRVAAAGWVLLAVGLVTGINRAALSGITPEVDLYQSAAAFSTYGQTGIRLDFLASLVAGLGAAWLARRLVHDDRRDVYDRLIVVYLLFGSAFLLFGFVAFSDRLAAYAWFALPLLAWYPLSRRTSAGLPVVAVAVVTAAGVGLGTLTALAG